jgi:hypothetical protein
MGDSHTEPWQHPPSLSTTAILVTRTAPVCRYAQGQTAGLALTTALHPPVRAIVFYDIIQQKRVKFKLTVAKQSCPEQKKNAAGEGKTFPHMVGGFLRMN